MKNKIIKITILYYIVILFNVNISSNTFANETSNGNGGGIKIIVTEMLPGGNCSKIDSQGNPGEAKEGEPQMYECIVAKGFSSVTVMLGKIIKYFTYIAALGGVLFIIINGVMYSMGGLEQSMKDSSKKRITGTLIGLILLFLSGVILNLIAPWIYK